MSPNCILERVATTKSTNDDLLARWRAGELIDPVALITYEQTAGKGRSGRVWVANPEDTLCFSLAYPFRKRPSQLSGLSLVIGLAVVSGIASALGLKEAELHQQGLRLKWPNDLLLNNAKLGGILIEGGQTDPSAPTWMIIGIGLNLRHADSTNNALPKASAFGVAALDQLAADSLAVPDIEYIWLKLIESLEKHITEFDLHGFTHFKHTWAQWDAFNGTPVCISGAGKEPVFGIANGVDESGALLLKQHDETITIHSGDISLRVQS